MAQWKLVQGDCVETLRRLRADSVDAVVTDPPYGLEFMGKAWDKIGDARQPGDTTFQKGSGPFGRATVRYGGTPAYASDGATVGVRQQAWHEAWLREALRVLKPGGYLVAFGGSRTAHRLIAAAEDVGFEIRDVIMWLYGSGFPKSLDVSKAIDKAAGAEREVVGRRTGRAATPVQDIRGGNWMNGVKGGIDCSAITAPATPEAERWNGWGTALKPANEPILLARKPLGEKTVAANALTHGVGALNIDAARIPTGDVLKMSGRSDDAAKSKGAYGNSAAQETHQKPGQVLGRWPANVVLSHHPDCIIVGQAVTSVDRWACVPDCPTRMLDAQSGPSGASAPAPGPTAECNNGHGVYGKTRRSSGAGFKGDSGGASRFFYNAKAPNRERWGWCRDCVVAFPRTREEKAKHKGHKLEWHPTVKPVDLVRWLVRLVVPPGGVVLDPFSGTGTTGEAALREDRHVVLLEREAHANDAHPYCEIIEARMVATVDLLSVAR